MLVKGLLYEHVMTCFTYNVSNVSLVRLGKEDGSIVVQRFVIIIFTLFLNIYNLNTTVNSFSYYFHTYLYIFINKSLLSLVFILSCVRFESYN